MKLKNDFIYKLFILFINIGYVLLGLVKSYYLLILLPNLFLINSPKMKQVTRDTKTWP